MTDQNDGSSLVRTVLVVLGAILLFPILMMTFMMPMMGMMGGMMGGMGGMGAMDGGFSLWPMGMMLVWLVVLVGVGYAIYRVVGGRTGVGSGDRALEELRAAYARGDLTDEEFEQRRAKLRSGE